MSEQENGPASGAVWHKGGCHCGAVRFEVRAPARPDVVRCNCSMCRMVGFLHLIVEKQDFRLTSGEAALSEYRFNTGTARHLFCRICGVKSFYVPRSHPDGYSVNANCLDPDTLQGWALSDFDGANWEANIEALRAADADPSDMGQSDKGQSGAA